MLPSVGCLQYRLRPLGTPMNPPQVCLIASLGPPPYVGGIENVVDTLLRSSRSDAVAYSVFDTYRAADKRRTTLAKVRYAAALFLRCRASLRRTNAAIAHIHFCSYADFWKHSICLSAARSAGVRTVFHLHGGAFDGYYRGLPLPLRLSARSVFRSADRVVALSAYWQSFLAGIVPADRIRVINNPIDCARLMPRQRVPDAARPSILLLGSLGRRKGHYDVLDALPAVVARHPGVRVLFAGADEEPGAGDALRRIVDAQGLASHVEFLGQIGFDRKVALFGEITMLILPSHGENMPISVLEAMAAGVPVVSTRVGAIPEALDDGHAGLLIDAGNVKALAAAILSLLDNPALAAELANAGARRARTLWDAERIVARVGDLYSELLPIAPPT